MTTSGLSDVLFLDPNVELGCNSKAEGYDYAKRLSREGRTPFDFHWRVEYNDADALIPELKGLVVFGRDAWVGWAVADSQKMIGADAIIGIPASSSDPEAGTVEAYDLIGQNSTSTSESVAPRYNSSVFGEIQQVTKGNNTSTVMQFIRPFIDSTGMGNNITTNGTQIILFAAGLDSSFAYHSQRGIFALDLVGFECAADATVGPSQTTGLAMEETALRSPDGDYDWLIMIFDGGGKFFWRLDETTGVMYMKLSVSVDTGWLGFAVSDDQGQMVGSDAVIGLPGAGVQQYNLWGYSKEEVLVRDAATQSLLDDESSIEVSSVETVMTFARYTAAIAGEPNSRQIIAGENTFIFAKGKLNVLSDHLATAVDQLSVNVLGALGSYNNSTTTTSTSSAASSNPADIPDACTKSTEDGYTYAHMFADNVMFHWTLEGANSSEPDPTLAPGYIKGKMVVDGRMGWLGWGLSADGTMVGSGAVIGLLEEQDVKQYILWGKKPSNVVQRTTQRLKDTSIYYTNGKTSMEFARPVQGASSEELSLVPESQYVIFAFSTEDYLTAHGKSNSGTVWMNLLDCQFNNIPGNSYDLAYAHGWMMSMAYGAVLPLGILVSRYGKTRRNLGFVVHVTLQLTGFSMAVAGLCFAHEFVKEVYEQPTLASTHGKRGVAIICLTFLQICLGVVRPRAPNGRWENKSKRRWLWEYCHKVLACVTLILAYYQVYDGLDRLDATINKSSWYAAFSGLLAVVAGCFVVLEIANRRKKKPKDTWWEPQRGDRNPHMSANL